MNPPAEKSSSERRVAAETAAWVSRLLQTGDSLYPTGAYAHSFGLEGLIQDGLVRDRASLRAYLLEAAVPALRQVDLPLVAHSWRAAARSDWTRLGELAELATALKAPAELRGASERIGRQRAELAAALHPGTSAAEYFQHARRNGWPFASAVAAGVEMQALGAPLEAALASYFYTAVAGLVSAAMKLLRLGQNAAQSLLTEALAQTGTVSAHAAEVGVEDLGWFSPWLDIASARHETADARMFIS